MGADECERRLTDGSLGRIALLVAGEPLIVPVVYRYAGGAVVFRTAAGEKLDAISVSAPCAFELDDWDTGRRTGWSVLVRGTAEPVYDEAEIAALERLGVESWVPDIQPTTWVRLRPAEITGRAIR
jgi:uncharacterized protein